MLLTTGFLIHDLYLRIDMTPCVLTAKRAKIKFILHEYEHDANAGSYGLEAAEKMNKNPQQIFKTLVVDCGNNQLAVAVVPVSGNLNLKNCAKALAVKKVKMAEAHDVEKSTGYVLGGVSPLGQKKRLKTVIDSSAQGFETIFVSAGKRGLEIELSAEDLAKLAGAKFAQIAQISE